MKLKEKKTCSYVGLSLAIEFSKKRNWKVIEQKKISNQETHFIFNILNRAIFLENKNINI